MSLFWQRSKPLGRIKASFIFDWWGKTPQRQCLIPAGLSTIFLLITLYYVLLFPLLSPPPFSQKPQKFTLIEQSDASFEKMRWHIERYCPSFPLWLIPKIKEPSVPFLAHHISYQTPTYAPFPRQESPSLQNEFKVSSFIKTNIPPPKQSIQPLASQHSPRLNYTLLTNLNKPTPSFPLSLKSLDKEYYNQSFSFGILVSPQGRITSLLPLDDPLHLPPKNLFNQQLTHWVKALQFPAQYTFSQGIITIKIQLDTP